MSINEELYHFQKLGHFRNQRTPSMSVLGIDFKRFMEVEHPDKPLPNILLNK